MATALVKNGATVRDSQTGYNGFWCRRFNLTLNASGYMLDSNDPDHSVDGTASDTIVLGILPAGLELHDMLAIVSTACTEGIDAVVGFAYCDGVDSSDFPQDADYFSAGVELDAASRTRAENTAVAPGKLPKDAYLKLTMATAAAASACVVDFIIYGEYKGI